jgi:Kef-type K+ transport system membrane component KefB
MDFQQIALVFVIAAGFAFVTHLIRQPLLVGYLIAGVIIGTTGIFSHADELTTLSQIGVALLLFLLGLEMKLSELKAVGKTALVTAVGQIAFTSILGIIIARSMGFDWIPALYISIALTFSSTIIMVKLLSEKKDLQSLYGRIAIGVLLVQDFVAILILLFLAGVADGSATPITFLATFFKAIGLFVSVWILSKRVVPFIFEKFLTGSTELMFIASIAWALGFTALVAGPLGFSLEIGGFLAGLALSNLPEHLQISTRTRPIRDFFLTIFFVVLGTEIALGVNFMEILPPAIVFSLFVLIGNPLIVLIILGLLGYKKRTAFMAGLTVAQISEFSLILMAMGANLLQVESKDVSIVVLVGVITMTVSTYFILESERLYSLFEKYLGIFERKNSEEKVSNLTTVLKNHVVLVGCDRSGRVILQRLRKSGVQYVVVDFNPTVFEQLVDDGTPAVFGDIADDDIQDAINLSSARIIITTHGSVNDNLVILDNISKEKSAITIFTATNQHEARLLYRAGATFVAIPDVVAGTYLQRIVTLALKGRSHIAAHIEASQLKV